MNLIEKFHAVLVSEEVAIWHFHEKKEGPKFYHWPSKAEPWNTEGQGHDTMEEMIEAAYARIDPLKKPLPPCPSVPILPGDEPT